MKISNLFLRKLFKSTCTTLAVGKAGHLNIKIALGTRPDWLASEYSLRVFASHFCFYVKVA